MESYTTTAATPPSIAIIREPNTRFAFISWDLYVFPAKLQIHYEPYIYYVTNTYYF
jgi:hypothetical protein